MPRALIEFPLAALALVLVALNTLVHATPLLLLALVKALVPHAGFRRRISAWLILLAESWIAVNSKMIDAVDTRLVVEERDPLRRDGWYLVLSNHQSWVDIPVLQKLFNRRIPFLKFFLKNELIWVPVLGLAWWALDFPFMKRYSRQVLEKHPELRGKDIEATRRACEKYRELPVSVMNFVEGTRFTVEKHSQGSPYARLLPPRAGGVAFVLDAMGDMLDAVVDVTLHYPGGKPTIYDLFSGRIREVRAHVRTIPIPAEFLGGSYENDPVFRERFQAWINGLWAEKDARLAQLSGVRAPQ